MTDRGYRQLTTTSWDVIIVGAGSAGAALDSFLAEWMRHAIDAELFLFARAVPDRETYDVLFEAALDRGVHPRVGVGDNPRLFERNSDMVKHAVEMAARRGLAPVSPAELRDRVKLPGKAQDRTEASV